MLTGWLVIGLLAGCVGTAPAESATGQAPQPMPPQPLSTQPQPASPTSSPSPLADRDARYDPAVKGVWGKVGNNGYHTRLKPGTPVHPTREALRYAMDLLDTGEPDRLARAEDILRAVYSLQITNPTDPAFGIWPWYMDEPVAQMDPPDWNWADFCGAQLVELLNRRESRLSPEMREQSRAALRNAAWSIFRRNVQPDYTNIAVMGGGVVVAAGEILRDPLLVEYGRQRLENCVAQFDKDGGFNEYNSPAYTTIVLTECERALGLVKDPRTRAAAEALRLRAWKTIAESFHPATGQWAGPHARAYSDLLNRGWAEFLAEKTGVPIEPHPLASGGGPSSEVEYHDCPPELKDRFAKLPAPELEIHRRFIARDPDTLSIRGTTWFSADACLGSVNYDSFWIQRRPLIGYWRTPSDPAVVLKLRFLRDGNDFASGAVRTAQSNGSTLSLITLLTNKGSHHDHIDIPKDGIFPTSSFRARLELDGKGVKLLQVSDTVVDLIAGNTSARVTAGPGRFAGTDNGVGPLASQNIKLETGHAENSVWLDLVFVDGPQTPYKFADLTEAWATLGLTLRTGPQSPVEKISAKATDGNVAVRWGALTVTGPTRPSPY